MKKKPVFRIEPFKHKLEIDPDYADKTWESLEHAINEIHNKNASGLSYEELYRSAYNMVLYKFGDRLYNGLVETVTKHMKRVAEEIDSFQDDWFLDEMRFQWQDHNRCMQMIRDILMYMDRTYVRQHHKTHVHQLGLDLWRDHVIRHPSISERLRAILLDNIRRERKGEVINKNTMETTIKMLVDLGQRVYVDDFERHFLETSSEFYRVEAQELLSTCNCPEYLRRVAKRLEEESRRVSAYLDDSTGSKITAVVETELINNQMTVVLEMENSGLVALLQDEKVEDLLLMYKLLGRPNVKDGLSRMRDITGRHIKESGKQLVLDPERQKDAVDFSCHLLEFRDKYEHIIRECFKGNKEFTITMNQAFEHFVNLNPRCPEYLSLFMDDKLRQGTKGQVEDDTEMLMDRTIIIFRFLQEKDVFEKYYKQHLAKRLLSGKTGSDDAERMMLLKLKQECGYQFTSKLESMFTDIKTSHDMMKEYKNYCQNHKIDRGLDLSVHVLTTGSWPTQPGSHCNLPREVEACCEDFRKFYLQSHSGRKLAWQTNMGFADLRASFNTKKHELNVSTYQMCILMLFNDADSLTYKELQEATGIPALDLKRNLQSLSLVKGKNVLKKDPMTKEVNEDDVFTYNASFASKLYKVRIGTVAASKESEPEKLQTRQRVEEDRKPQIEAAIVRIMKARRVLDHNSVITEVTKQLSERFVPDPNAIKKRIEGLIEREFIERDKKDRKLYRYLA
uniref:Cullin 3 n=1 Tax=Tetraselmis sp. GSL018 TaxID=582737 RepID=A0A061S151_9CHLO|mmetsp:Transcript_22691/g.54310  ORF Transcript_22691/g.54310 Transcript_22691/m.54310 type:complete len:734 (-) Transcript_22691:344-2545(-)|eukprot:CAMPEP_0177610640 /NCGR_PEP_ID=MMETSP0419_2-20121207/19902_1 /TAXON_ID=582737 /ORGANISM="Tetraselmis sp., Strain GSL018" /LENGTH=733 /DNA_ID=CAMNT_0019105989 /DNA_START=358 /DNA_END=2559 /DNA_ORIENTATION=-